MARDELASDSALLTAQVAALVDWLSPLAAGPGAAEAFAAPSVLPGWDLRTLLGHVVLVVDGMRPWLSRLSSQPPLTPYEFVQGYRPAADSITERSASSAGDDSPAQLLDRLRAAGEQIVPSVALLRSTDVIEAPRGPIQVGDWTATRVLDLVTHVDDFARSLPGYGGKAPFVAGALRRCARLLAAMICEKAPGHAVELRIPPATAVQIVEGPRHTRGTPPNVVETDPRSWLRLATGRAQFADLVANGTVRADGHRADLTELLPLFS